MHRIRLHTLYWILVSALLALAVSGCDNRATIEAGTDAPVYGGALDTSYENAVDVTSQLALGTLNLEDTEHAVTEDQAARLLPLWQVLSGGALQGAAERYAVIRQIEAAMAESQVSAIVAMRLTQQDVQTWAQSVGGRTAPGGSQEQGGRQRPGGTEGQQPQAPGGMSTEERATRRAQFGQQERPTGGSSGSVVNAVVRLLGERSGAAIARRPAARSTPGPTSTPAARPTTPPSLTAMPTRQEATPTSTATPTAAALASPTPAATATSATPTPASNVAAPTATPVPVVTPHPALAQVQDTDPGPPLTIEISLNRARQDPLVEQSQQFKITGLVRNDGSQTYDVSALHVTFYDAEGFRGTFVPAIRDGKVVGGEWLWHGQTKADFACLLLAPGEECPFMIEITAQDMASFLIHPDAAPTERESTPIKLSGVRLVADSTDYLRITGTATNSGSVKAKNVTVSGVLLDASGQMVSMGSTYVLQEDITPGESVRFDLRVEKEPYVRYLLYAQAERDWE